MNATTQLETINVNAEKNHELGNQQPSAVALQHGEGSTTSEQSRRVQENSKCLEPVEVCKTCNQSKPLSEFYFNKKAGKLRLHCKACVYESQNDYRKRNKEKLRIMYVNNARKYRERHPDKVSAGFAAWREPRKDELNARSAEWRKNNQGAVNHYKAKRRALSRNATPSWANIDSIKAIYAKAREFGMVVDHEIPLRGKLVSGLHVEYNLRIVTRSDNAKKYNKFSTV